MALPRIIMREDGAAGVNVPPWLLWPLVAVVGLGGGGSGLYAMLRGAATPIEAPAPRYDVDVARLDERLKAVERAVVDLGVKVDATPAAVEAAVSRALAVKRR